jgi:hypothetical protein
MSRAKARAVPETFDLATWSIGITLSVAIIYLALLH